jgi:predicted glutamine amidotransferase
MCELLGMDCNTPTDLVFSFTGFAQRGGCTGPHSDGWGVAFFEGRAARVFRETRACADSPLAAFLRGHSIKSLQSIAHIRLKTRGRVSLANTHPFVRELWGRQWVFAHNGNLKGVRNLSPGRFSPVGDTDSEHAFCYLLNRLQKHFPQGATGRPLAEAIARIGGELAELGTFNFLLGNGAQLYARCDNKLCYIVRQSPFGRATLKDQDITVDFSAVTTANDRVAVIATTPLTVDEVWTHGEPATLWVFHKGRCALTLRSGRPIARPAPKLPRGRVPASPAPASSPSILPVAP